MNDHNDTSPLNSWHINNFKWTITIYFTSQLHGASKLRNYRAIFIFHVQIKKLSVIIKVLKILILKVFYNSLLVLNFDYYKS